MKIASKDRTEPIEHERGRFASTRYKLGEAAGARELGASLYEVAPGKTAWPRHAHLGNEEAIYILEGSGLLRVGDETKRVVAGDFVSFVRGKAHALSETCENGACVPIPCADINCPIGDVCYAGACYDPCTETDECTGDDACYPNGACLGDPCDGVQCPIGQLCYAGACYETCNSDDPCTPPSDCFDGRCAMAPCDGVLCPIGQRCYAGLLRDVQLG